MRFTLKQLRYVEAAGRLGSIARAAQEQNISQSSITAAIDGLEREVGYDIFVRAPSKGIRMTPGGQETLRLIRGFIDQARHFDFDLKSVSGNPTGALRIACYATAAPSFLPPILKAFTEQYPDISIKLLEGNMETCMAFLNDGEADLAFIYDQVIEAPHEFIELFAAPPYVLIPAENPLSERASVTLEDVADLPMILLDLPHTREYFESVFAEVGLTPNIVHSSRSAEITRALVAGGLGYTILNICPPDYRAGDSRFRPVPLKGRPTTPIFGIAAPKGTRQPSIVQTFVKLCLDLKQSGVFESITVK